MPAEDRSASSSMLLWPMHHCPAAILISPSVGLQKLPQVVLSWGSPRSAPPAEPALLKYCCGQPQAEGSCRLPPRPSASGLTPVIWLWEEAEGIANIVWWWGLKAKKEKTLLFFRVVIAHQFCIIGEFWAEFLLSVGQAVIFSLIGHTWVLQV